VLSIFTAGLRECLSTNLGLTYYRNRDGLGGITQRHPDLNVEEFNKDHPQLVLTDKSGVDVALDLIRTSPSRTITYIALGPLTNLAHMVRRDGKLVKERIGRIICMGGALDVPGNTSPVAECQSFMSTILLVLLST
jgi:inosine-uridine nucleoside N-ribohydrolase